MATGRIVKAVQRWIWREVRVMGLYALWRSLGVTITLLAFGLLVLGAAKYLSATPPESFIIPVTPPPRTTLFPHPDIPALQGTANIFFRGLPYVGPLWGHLSPFDYHQPKTYLWGLLFPLGWLGAHLLRRKVKDAPLASSSTTVNNNNVNVVNNGTIDRIEAIAVRLTLMALPSQREAAQALVKIAEAVREEPTLSPAIRREQLDRLLALAQQTELPAANRSPSLGRATVRALDAVLSRVANLADIWSAWGPAIKAFFEVSD